MNTIRNCISCASRGNHRGSGVCDRYGEPCSIASTCATMCGLSYSDWQPQNGGGVHDLTSVGFSNIATPLEASETLPGLVSDADGVALFVVDDRAGLSAVARIRIAKVAADAVTQAVRREYQSVSPRVGNPVATPTAHGSRPAEPVGFLMKSDGHNVIR